MDASDADDLSRRGFLLGTAGTVVAAGTAGTAVAQESADGNESAGNESAGDGGGNESAAGGSGGGGSGATETVEVVDSAFEPAEITIQPGTTVEWAWQNTSMGHNISPDSQPEGANWEGHLQLEDGDFTYSHTFEVEGDYDYVCVPHAGIGMVGTVTVDPEASAMAEGPIDLVPDAAWSLLIASLAGMVSVLSLAYAFMRYGGNPPE